MCGFLVEHSNDGDINIDDLNQLLSLSENRGPDSTKSILIDNTWMALIDYQFKVSAKIIRPANGG